MPNDCAAGPWQSGDTAPKDGRVVLLVFKQSDMVYVGRWGSWWENDNNRQTEWGWIICNNPSVMMPREPIAWAPLHAPQS